ncbi:uncharacterized protein RSE6_05022 [Rhynchosporium secalis]|uniref:Uncharacterized protein n=1 Tax=Rhynchosporium secalis TaxID=38038 RepID=A0A1E1M6Q8_RHYSE|nr:uncharacterized protein RSE6_05022 [Rhynchosporium secalis]
MTLQVLVSAAPPHPERGNARLEIQWDSKPPDPDGIVFLTSPEERRGEERRRESRPHAEEIKYRRLRTAEARNRNRNPPPPNVNPTSSSSDRRAMHRGVTSSSRRIRALLGTRVQLNLRGHGVSGDELSYRSGDKVIQANRVTVTGRRTGDGNGNVNMGG